MGRAGVSGAIGLAALAAASAASAASIDGYWSTRGYGQVLKIQGEQMRVWDLGGGGCAARPDSVPVSSLLREPRLINGGRRLTSRTTFGITVQHHDRLDALPAVCARPAAGDPKDPLRNFDAFWSWFDQYYAFFDERGVDWNALRDRYRPQVTAKTTDAELQLIFRAMLAALGDRHTSLRGEGFYINPSRTPLFANMLPDDVKITPETRQRMVAVLDSFKAQLAPGWRLLDPGTLRQEGAVVTSGTAGGGRFGYVAVVAEAGYSEDGEGEVETARGVLDRVFAGFQGKEGVIVDIRVNSGGEDQIALDIAGQLTDRDRPGFQKCVRDGAGWTPTNDSVVRRRPNAFSGPVIVMISPNTVSAGENLAMITRTFPNVLLVGDRTASVHADVLQKHLPNGWIIAVSNEVFVAPDGTVYESIGTPPDVLVPFDPAQNRASGEDPAMQKSLDLLASPKRAELARTLKRGALGRPSPCAPLDAG